MSPLSGAGPGQGVDDVLAGIRQVEDRVRALVDLRRSNDANPDDPFRGLYVNDDDVDRLLSPESPVAATAEQPTAARVPTPEAQLRDGVRLPRLARDAGLSDLDVDLLLIALLPDLDSRFERLYGYLNDDVTRRRATVGLALELAGASPLSAQARARLSPAGPLTARGLLLVEETDRPYLTRGLRIPDRVTAHLLGDDGCDSALAPLLAHPTPYATPLTTELSRALASGTAVVHIRECDCPTAGSAAVAALHEAGRPAVAIDLERVVRDPDPVGLCLIAAREALLTGGGLVAGPVESLSATAPEALRRLIRCGVPLVLTGTATWDPAWAEESPLTVDAPVLGPGDRLELWRQHLDGDAGLDPGELALHLALGPDQVGRAVGAARGAAAMTGGPLTADHVRRGVRAQNAAGLERLSRRIEPEVGWDDLVLAPVVHRALREVTARARHRHTVLTEWRMRRGGGRGRGITALFAGDSGTGKTMSAEVIAADLGLDLYTVNLATVVDKYVGETEKNLERIFAEAGGVNAVLFFDEADAIFGKRSEVRDAHDRYANIESAYLLQRLETFDGLAVLATNLRANIDEAFTRRLDAIVDFPAPTAELRLALWHRCLAPPLPLGADVDLDFCARSFELAGGNIRSASITAAYLAADSGSAVGMAHLIAAVEQEYRKLGRLVLEREFGDYLALLR